MQSDRGTRREHLLNKKNRPKPKAEWIIKARHYAKIGAPIAFVLLVAIWYVASGRLGLFYAQKTQDFYSATTEAGLRAEYILIEGRQQTTQDEIINAMGIKLHQSLLAIDPIQTAAQLKTVPWIASAAVQRRLPNTLFVKINERTPIGLWQKNQTHTLVDKEGVALATENLDRWGNMPILIGDNAPQAAPELMQELAKFPTIYSRVKAMTYINNRRWNLRLDSGTDILLPEIDMPKALARLDKQQKGEQILDKNIISIDLRLADRLGIIPDTSSQTDPHSVP